MKCLCISKDVTVLSIKACDSYSLKQLISDRKDRTDRTDKQVFYLDE